jgi:hypothetical protein
MKIFVSREWVPMPRPRVAVVRPGVSILNQLGDFFGSRFLSRLLNQPSGRTDKNRYQA